MIAILWSSRLFGSVVQMAFLLSCGLIDFRNFHSSQYLLSRAACEYSNRAHFYREACCWFLYFPFIVAAELLWLKEKTEAKKNGCNFLR